MRLFSLIFVLFLLSFAVACTPREPKNPSVQPTPTPGAGSQATDDQIAGMINNIYVDDEVDVGDMMDSDATDGEVKDSIDTVMIDENIDIGDMGQGTATEDEVLQELIDTFKDDKEIDIGQMY